MATSNRKLLHSLFRLPSGVKVIDVIRHPHLFEYSVTFPLNRACPVCGGNNTVIKGHSENSRIHHLPINEYGTFIRFDQTSIRKWQPYICNTWKHICSNASCEGLNREIKDVKRIACGFNRFDSFRKRILLTCGPYKLEYQSFSIRSEKDSIVETYHISSIQGKR